MFALLEICQISILFLEWWDLKNPEEKDDVVPEIWQGHNIVDFIDPDIMEKLDALEKEEEERENAGLYDNDEVPIDVLSLSLVGDLNLKSATTIVI